MTSRSLIAILAGAVLLGAVLWRADGADPPEAAPEAEALPPRPASETPEVQPAAGRRPARGGETAHLVGVLDARETVELVAKEAGRVAAVTVKPGDRVRRGQVLAEISPDGLELQRQAQEARVREARVAVERASLQADLGRRKVQRRQGHPELFALEDREEKALELESALLELEAARARRAQVEAGLRLLRERIARSRIAAPRDGLVSERLVDPGASVAPGQPVFQLVDPSARIVRFAVPAALHGRLAVGMAVGVTPAGTAARAAAGGCAVIDRISPKVEESAPLLFVAARLEAGDLAGFPLGTALRVHPENPTGCGPAAVQGGALEGDRGEGDDGGP